MPRCRRVLCLFLLTALGCQSARDAERVARIDASLASAARFMAGQQSPDGAWRSSTYGFMKDGLSLTPHVISCLYFLPQGGGPMEDAFDRGVEFLIGQVGPDGKLKPVQFIYPVYTAAEASRMILKHGRSERHLLAHRAWLGMLRSNQLDERLGWSASDLEYGGWGFSPFLPAKPRAGQARAPWAFSNLTATIYGLAALRSAKVPMDDPSYRGIRLFVERCQNFAEDPDRGDPKFDDGGFFFAPAEELRNKGGVAGTDRLGRKRFHSYGSMTADGLRALLTLGLGRDHPRVVAARDWLVRHFDAAHNPGRFVQHNEDLRDATYYYWCWSVAHAFLHMDVRGIDTRLGGGPWTDLLVDELLRRQRPDGSWTNRFTDAREDDPLVATPFAASALAICRRMIAGDEGHSAVCLPGHMTTRRQ
jgi:squalene-hopene/tetraprenyl-beta-curcumene cyclase